MKGRKCRVYTEETWIQDALQISKSVHQINIDEYFPYIVFILICICHRKKTYFFI